MGEDSIFIEMLYNIYCVKDETRSLSFIFHERKFWRGRRKRKRRNLQPMPLESCIKYSYYIRKLALLKLIKIYYELTSNILNLKKKNGD